MGERYSWREGVQENYQRVVQDRNLTIEHFLQKPEYIEARRKICYRHLRFFDRDAAFDINDLFQAADMKVMEIAERYPDKLAIMPYIKKAVQNAMFGLRRKIRRTLGEVCLVHELDDGVPGPNLVVPTRDRDIERASTIDDIIYQIGEEFGQQAAENMKIFIDRCSDVYDLHLSKPPSTETKDRVKVVTAMDLSDEEMLVYAEVLLGVRRNFPHYYLDPEKNGKARAKKFLTALLGSLQISPAEFVRFQTKDYLLSKYHLRGFYSVTYRGRFSDLVSDIFKSIKQENIAQCVRWQGQVSLEEISDSLCKTILKTGKNPAELTKGDLTKNGLNPGIIQRVFKNKLRLAIEFAFPGTFPYHAKEAVRIAREYGLS